MFGSRLHRLAALAVTATLASGPLMLGVPSASAAKPPPAPLVVTAVCASAVSGGGFASVSVSGQVTGLRPKTSFGVAVDQPTFLQVTTSDPVFTSNGKGVLTLKAVTVNAATDGNPPYTSGPAIFNALYTGLIGIQGGGQGLVADLDVTIDTSNCP